MATQKQVKVNVSGKLVDPNKITIPDLWKTANRIKNELEREEVLEVWNLCHWLLRHITGNDFNMPRNITIADHARWLKAELAAEKKAVKK